MKIKYFTSIAIYSFGPCYKPKGGLLDECLSLLQKSSASTAAKYKKTDTAQPDIKDDAEEEKKPEEGKAKDQEQGLINIHIFYSVTSTIILYILDNKLCSVL